MRSITEILKETDVYVVHALNGYDHQAEHVNKLFSQYNIKFEFVTEGDVSLVTDEVLEQHFTQRIIKNYRPGSISCTLNHMKAYEKLLAGNSMYALVFEDDPWFLSNLNTKLDKVYHEMEQLEGGFIVSLENTTLTFPSYFQTRKNQMLYRASAGRMAGAYIIDREGAKEVLGNLKQSKCDQIVDLWHNVLIEKGVIKMYWAHPALVEQGSHNGMMSSTISSKQTSNIRKLNWLVRKNFKLYFQRLFNQRRIINS